MKAILLSGGMDSAALAYWKRPDLAITIDYGQLAASAELRAASAIAKELGVSHETIRVDCKNLGTGQMSGKSRLRGTPTPEWWPYRNQLLITLAAMKVVGTGVEELMIGTIKGDDKHADGRTKFIKTIDQLLRIQEYELRVTSPAAELSAVELIRQSRIPFDVLAWAHSCHAADLACGDCRGCGKRSNTYTELGWHAD